VYARRGGIQVYDSIVSGNLVDGSGGGLGSTGDILVVRSHMDGNTTDGDGGAIYTDEDGDVTVSDSTVSGSTADGPGGAIFTLDGDVTIINSTLSGNRADDRGGAIAGEATVTVLNSTISRNLAVAHVGGGIWSRGNLYVGNSTISNNYAEAKGGGLHAAGILTLVSSTVIDNIASVAANIGVGERLVSFGSVIGPGKIDGNGGEAQPTETNCDAPQTTSLGYNVITDHSCGLAAAGDIVGASGLGPLRGNGGRHETRLPGAGSPAIDRIPPAACGRAPLDERLDGEQHLRGLIEARRAMLARDQRGLARPQGRGCDAGAVEVAR
jgi:predicted outer membrane repeat protein